MMGKADFNRGGGMFIRVTQRRNKEVPQKVNTILLLRKDLKSFEWNHEEC